MDEKLLMHRLLTISEVLSMGDGSLAIEKVGRKWKVIGSTDEWIFKRYFNRKWKAKIAVEVYKSGGRWKDYCEKINLEPSHRSQPSHSIEVMRKAYEEITKLSPTCEEITDYGKFLYETNANYGVVTLTNGNDHFQRLHDTWYSHSKYGGRVHIDLGCNGYHLMLTKNTYIDFIDFVKKRRSA